MRERGYRVRSAAIAAAALAVRAQKAGPKANELTRRF
ncbi:exported hypothetical protein [Paraburkholderia piptadeniae]|uniref:Uncharacterized protein n=1 Tax=Paraburkholderia piptadeniae TaxID=1701573 RepID=A0A1N7SD17_9BURK|nr:exported hypothetical protein [Paraburkholderia piptadeniae]